jgi:mevalonate kinase
MSDVYATAPGAVKLYGEHVVLYGKSSAAIAVDPRAKVYVKDTVSKGIEFRLDDLGEYGAFTKNQLQELFLKYKSFKEDKSAKIGEFVSSTTASGVSAKVLPYAIIAGRIMMEYGTGISGKTVGISSDIPISKGFASSAACSVAFTAAMAKSLGIDIPSEKFIDMARDGERIVHKNSLAGKIDVNSSFYGGCVVYNDSNGVVRETVPEGMHMLVVDTGPKKPTSETVAAVRSRLEKDEAGTKRIFDMVEECTTNGIEALKNGDIAEVGRYMYRNQELLKDLGVSNEGLDSVVKLSKKLGAYGAKLSGGGGGGIAIVLAEDLPRLSKEFSSLNLKVYEVDVSYKGVKTSKMYAKSIA